MKQDFDFWDRLQAKVITPYFDNNLWEMISADSSIVEEKFLTNFKNLKIYYPNLEDNKLTKAGLSFVLDNFSSYRFKCIDVWMDPHFGWVIPSNLKIFKYSFPYSVDPWDQIKRRPRTLNFLRKNFGKREIEIGASIRFGWQNYYHFFVDGLTQLRALDLFDPEKKIPIIVPEYFDKSSFSKDFFNKKYLGNREVVIQGPDEYLFIKKLYLFKEDILSESLDAVVDLLRPKNWVSNERKFFITRNSENGRTIRNMDEISPILENQGFDIVDCSLLSLEDQAKMFSTASIVVGIHGAGLVNTIFKKGETLKVLEIAPSLEFQPEHYKNICKKFGFEYKIIFGEKPDDQKNFNLNPESFSNILKDF